MPLKEAGVQVVMVKEKFDNDLGGQMQKDITIFADGVFCKQISDHTKTKMAAMVEKGYWCGVHPFGYTKVFATDSGTFQNAEKEPPKRLVPDEVEAPLVRHAYEMALSRSTQADIREYLNSLTSRKWTVMTVKNLLTNPVYKGDIVFGQWQNVGAYEPVVDGETWEAVQTIIAARQYRPAREKADDFTYYLHGRVHCLHCGCPYTQSSAWGRSTRVHYYVCQTTNRTASRGGSGSGNRLCPVGRVNAERVHATVLGYMDHAATHRTFMHKLIAQSGGWGSADDAQKALRGQLGKQKQAIEMRIANYIKAIGEGRMSGALLAALEKVEAEKETVCRQIEEAESAIQSATIPRPTAGQVQEAWGNIGRVWNVLSEEERADLLSSVVQSVEVTEKESVTLELLPWSHSLGSFAQNHSERFGLCTPSGSGSVRCYELSAHLVS